MDSRFETFYLFQFPKNMRYTHAHAWCMDVLGASANIDTLPCQYMHTPLLKYVLLIR